MSNSNWTTRNGRTSKRGLFVDAIWYCDCDPRLPAEKFQVKNGGKNHGRWFYTCQKPQTKRCGFFLWSDDAKIREEAAVLNNSRTEPGTEGGARLGGGRKLRSDYEAPQTPKRQSKIMQPITPRSKQRTPLKQAGAPSPQLSPHFEDNDDGFGWSSSAEEELAIFADSLDADRTASEEDESPRKIARTFQKTSPSKRTHDQMGRIPPSDITSSGTWPIDQADIFATPSTSTKSNARSGLLSPEETPSHPRRQLFPPSEPRNEARTEDLGPPEEFSSLNKDAFAILRPVKSVLSRSIENGLVALFEKHDHKLQGITKGRDLARSALQTKEKKVMDLQQRITALEAEKESMRSVIQHLKTDIATSPKKSQRSAAGHARRSQV